MIGTQDLMVGLVIALLFFGALLDPGAVFYIDQTDHDTKATFSLLVELARLELIGKSGASPVLTPAPERRMLTADEGKNRCPRIPAEARSCNREC